MIFLIMKLTRKQNMILKMVNMRMNFQYYLMI